MSNKLKFVLAAAVAGMMIAGCTPRLYDYSQLDLPDYHESNDNSLVFKIKENFTVPRSIKMYSGKKEELSEYGLKWERMAERYSSCVINNLIDKASREDLEIILTVWADNKTKEDIASNYADEKYGKPQKEQSIYLYSGISFDCMLGTSDYIEKMKERLVRQYGY